MARSVLSKFAYSDGLTPDVLYHMVNNNLTLDAAVWGAALPASGLTSAVKLETVYTTPVYAQPDFSMDVAITFRGSFEQVGGVWGGSVNKVVFRKDGAVVGELKVKSGVDFSEIANQSASGAIWDSLTSTGLKATLSSGSDYYVATSDGPDIIDGGAGHDWIFGYGGNDRLIGGSGYDTLMGLNGDDVLIGGRGNDTLNGGAGTDRAFGGRGRDTFVEDADNSNDFWRGGQGADFFEISSTQWTGKIVTVTDFNRAEGDKVDLRSDDSFIFNSYSEIRYIGAADFSGDAGVYEVRMSNGVVSVDNNSDGVADMQIMLDGLDSFGTKLQNWLKLPDGLDFV
jgi:Ca2+-binding RTX toxin-like protein